MIASPSGHAAYRESWEPFTVRFETRDGQPVPHAIVHLRGDAETWVIVQVHTGSCWNCWVRSNEYDRSFVGDDSGDVSVPGSSYGSLSPLKRSVTSPFHFQSLTDLTVAVPGYHYRGGDTPSECTVLVYYGKVSCDLVPGAGEFGVDLLRSLSASGMRCTVDATGADLERRINAEVAEACEAN